MSNLNKTVFHSQEATWTSIDDSEERRMQALWRSVITQALIDAASNSKKRIDKLNRARAIEWLKGDSEDFIEVCTLANMNAAYVRQRAQQAMKRGCKWRNDLRIIAPIRIDTSILEGVRRRAASTVPQRKFTQVTLNLR